MGAEGVSAELSCSNLWKNVVPSACGGGWGAGWARWKRTWGDGSVRGTRCPPEGSSASPGWQQQGESCARRLRRSSENKSSRSEQPVPVSRSRCFLPSALTYRPLGSLPAASI